MKTGLKFVIIVFWFMFCQPVLVSVSTVYLCDRVSDCLSEKSVCVSEVFVIFVWVSFTEFNCSLTFISNL